MVEREYNREAAVAYAQKWALSRNPAYADFEEMGGDCSNFISQCLYAGAGIMNYAPTYGWFYRSLNDRAPAWTSVRYLHRFLTTNKGVGPHGHEVSPEEMLLGDIIQMQIDQDDFQHTAMVTEKKNGFLYVSAHTYDALNRRLSSYAYKKIRFIHIDGVRKWN